MPIMNSATLSATPEFTIALLMAKAQAIVIKISHEIYLVYLRAGKILVQAMIIVVTETKKNISSFMSGNISFTIGSSPTVAPAIIRINRINANQRFPFPGTGSLSLPLANNTNTEDSPQVGINVSSAITTNVSPSRKTTSSRLLTNRCPLRFLISLTSAP